MAEIVVWGIPTCQSTRRALRYIELHSKRTPEFRNLRERPPTKTLLNDVLRTYDVKKLLNVSGQSYREGGYKHRMPSMSKSDIVEVILADPMLLKRPVVVTAKGIAIGYDEDMIAAIL